VGIARVVFLGTPQFAVPTLRAIVAAEYEVPLVVTQPDRPKGRGAELSEPPARLAARELGLAVFQPERIRRPEAQARLAETKPDVIVVVGYGQIIPQSVIDIPRYGILNVHASLLPKYRGAAPIQWAIANGESRTGVTIMQIDEGLDTGDMLRKAETQIAPEETAIELGERLAAMGADLLVETLRDLANGKIAKERQDPAQATYAPILKKEHGRIDFAWPARSIHDRVRGFLPWPGAYTHFRGQILHIWKSRVLAGGGLEPGRLAGGRRLLVGCGESTALELLEVQLEGRKRMPGAAFANGQRLTENDFMGYRLDSGDPRV
jgi:methionyl-tRNA formyltransferase